ncbi:hypothetical protein K2173_009893 [Erythroxylum novogranatense]|uniref:PGG domain-containing protein n=1 Tax=Erythroxylum novogranatense TaxID=1862640 RepID=A0AAV8SZ90_9ROSI|nr:hypothetical protein K2173_009893 [Erythroxylum novogranatense]
MRTGSEMEVETWFDEAEVDDVELGTYQQSNTAINEIEPGYDETEDADLIRSQRYQVGVETKTEYSVQPSNDAQIGSRRFQEEKSKKLDHHQTEKRKMNLKLYLAALQGKWDIAERIYENNGKEIIDHKITKRGETALHIAVSAGQTDFVGKLIQGMSKEAIRAPNKLGNTAFCYAATSGKVELAHDMLKKDKDLATIRGSKEMLPIYMAALLGHKKMVSYLYDKTSDEILTDDDRIDLLVTLIDNDIYDVALRMVEKHKDFLSTARDGNKETALDALARKNFAHQALSGTRTKLFNLLCCGADQKSNPLPGEAYRLLQLVWQEVLLYDDSTVSEVIGSPPVLIFKAAEQGNLEFLTTLICSYPDLVFEVDGNNYSIFHIAVLHRHEDVFKLIHEIGSSKSLVAAFKDGKKNNLLHLAAKLSPQNKLDAIPGAALQLQHELLWFEEVKKVVKKSYVEAKNLTNQTPGEIFLKEHKDLIEKGEKWMRDTADSCMLVATLIATVVFAAAFTVPGGNNQAGNPMFLHEAQFQVFAIADAISLIFSVSAVLNFLSILTSRYALKDFLQSLPKKLVQGLVMLFISVVAMMVAYIAAIFIIFKNGLLRIAIPIAVIAIFPGVLFIRQQSGLLRDVVRSTYMSKSLFRPNKPTLFYAGATAKATKRVAYVYED